jgi:hypothetical protein
MKKLLLLILVACPIWAMAQKKVKSGIIYSEHPYIETMRHFAEFYEKGDTAAMGRLFADSAKVYGMMRYAVDTAKVAQWSVPPSRTLAEAKTGWQQVFETWGQMKMRPIGTPDGLEYSNTRFTVQSWWLITLTNRKTKKVAKIEMVLFDIFNPDGKIAIQVGFYDPTSLLVAMK